MSADNHITWQDFEKIILKVGTITKAVPFDEAKKPSFILSIDLGEKEGIKKSSAQITHHYTCEELIGKQVICVTNFPKKQIGPIMSEVLVTGFYDENQNVILAVPDKTIQNGAKLA